MVPEAWRKLRWAGGPPERQNTEALGHCAVLMTSLLNPCGRIRDIVAFLQICLVIQSVVTDLGQIRNPRTPRVHTETLQASSEKHNAIWTCTTLGIQRDKSRSKTINPLSKRTVHHNPWGITKNIQRVTPGLALTRAPVTSKLYGRMGAPPS